MAITAPSAPPRMRPRLWRNFFPLHINTPLEKINAKINAFQPDVLCGYSSGIYLLSQEQLRGKIAVQARADY